MKNQFWNSNLTQKIAYVFASILFISFLSSTNPVSGQNAISIFDNTNKGTVMNNPKYCPYFYTNENTLISLISNYHWNSGKGMQPGTISLVDATGKIYGPWQARGTDGMGGVKNANWIVEPNITIPKGTYFIIDSDMATWSNNAASNYSGFSSVQSGNNMPGPGGNNFSANISGTYTTDYGKMVLSQNGNSITGTYTHNGGKISGTLTGNVLTGTWTQTNNNGQIKFEFSDTGFKGKWTYGASTDFGSTYNWNGNKTSEGNGLVNNDQPIAQYMNIAGNYKTTYNNLTISQSGNKITGVYNHDGGKIEGTVSGNILRGTWTQTSTSGQILFEFTESGFRGKWTNGSSTDFGNEWNWTGTKY